MNERSKIIERACHYVLDQANKRGWAYSDENGEFKKIISSKRKEISILVDRSSNMYGVKKETLKLILGI